MEHEKFMKELEKNLDNHEFAEIFDELMKEQAMASHELLSEQDAEDSYDYLELADSAPTKAQALKYAKKALEIEPDNIDAQIMVAELTSNTVETLLKKCKELIDNANQKAKSAGWFSDEYMGDFWAFYETRPYMRLRVKYLDTLIYCSMFGLAVEECKELLKLCENDNLGIRYRLMHLFAYFEDEPSALALLKQYDEKSTMFLLPLSMLYYKLGNFNKSAKYLRELNSVNEDTAEFFHAFCNHTLNDCFDDISEYSYSPFTIEEFAVEVQENGFLFACNPQYFIWAEKKLQAK